MPNTSPKRFTRSIKIKLEPATGDRLDRLAQASGYTVAALIRYCIDTGLPALEEKLAQAKVTPSTGPSLN